VKPPNLIPKYPYIDVLNELYLTIQFVPFKKIKKIILLVPNPKVHECECTFKNPMLLQQYRREIFVKMIRSLFLIKN
jgi:hypothetical protein